MLKTLFALVFFATLGAVGYAAWYATTPVHVAALPVDFELPPGTRFRTAVQRLKEAGVAVGPLEFELLARALGRDQNIKAGSYELTEAPTPLELLEKLTRGDVTQDEVRFIEGWNIRQVRAALEASKSLRHDSAGIDGPQLLAKLGASQGHPEGWFFPDTYLFAKGTSDLRVLKRAYEAMQRHLDEQWKARDPKSPYASPYEALIMASIIEKETGKPEERDMIAGVLVNRLRNGMLLQVDPTVIYGLGGKFDGNLKKVHLLTDGPYNTYTRPGLPPTPIAAPSLASLRAT